MGDIARIVARSAHGYGRHIGAVRFQQQPLKRHLGGDFDRFARIFVGHRTVEACVPAELPQLTRHLHAAGVAVEHAAHPGKFLHDGKAVRVRLTVVDDDGKVKLAREGELRAEHRLLEFLRRVLLPVIVQPDLPDGDDLRVLREPAQDVEIGVCVRRAVFGMIADGGVDVRILFRQRNRRAGAFQIAAGIEDQSHAVFRHGGKQRFAVGVELRIIVMRMSIENECHVIVPFSKGRCASPCGASNFSDEGKVTKNSRGETPRPLPIDRRLCTVSLSATNLHCLYPAFRGCSFAASPKNNPTRRTAADAESRVFDGRSDSGKRGTMYRRACAEQSCTCSQSVGRDSKGVPPLGHLW